MNWLNQFRNTVTLDKDTYKELLQQAQGLRDDKKRLQARVDELEGKLENLREETKKLADALTLAHRTQPTLTREAIAKRLGIPQHLAGEIDWSRMGIQLADDQRRQ